MSYGTCKDKTFSRDASSFAKASTFAKATVDETEDREAAEGESRDEAADEGRFTQNHQPPYDGGDA